MKNAHAIISDHVFRGRTSGHVNSVSKLIYGAKFYNDDKAFNALVKLCTGDIVAKSFDALVSVNTKDSKYNLPHRLAGAIAQKLGISYYNALSDKNSKCSTRVLKKRILLFDDVIYTGKTMNKASASILKAGAKSVTCFAIARSKSLDI